MQIQIPEEDKHYMISLTCGIQNRTRMNFSMKQKQIHHHREQTYGCSEEEGGKDWKFGTSRSKLLYIKWINNKVLLHSTRNYILFPKMNHNGKEKNLTMRYHITPVRTAIMKKR